MGVIRFVKGWDYTDEQAALTLFATVLLSVLKGTYHEIFTVKECLAAR